MQTNQHFDERWINYDDSDARYRLANDEIYALVKKYPLNQSHDEVVAKMWIIGRTYAAAVERRANKATTPGDFYYEYVAPAISNSELDEKIDAIKKKKYTEINASCIKDILSLHGYLVHILKDITEKEKRSLASKYLHFHLPQLVFIYDSRVASVIGDFIDGRLKGFQCEDGWDETYAKFFYKAFEIYKTLKRQGFSSLHDTLPRVIDTFLLRYCDSKNIDENSNE